MAGAQKGAQGEMRPEEMPEVRSEKAFSPRLRSLSSI